MSNDFKKHSDKLEKQIKIGIIQGHVLITFATLLIFWCLYKVNFAEIWWEIFLWLIIVGVNLWSIRAVLRSLRKYKESRRLLNALAKYKDSPNSETINPD